MTVLSVSPHLQNFTFATALAVIGSTIECPWNLLWVEGPETRILTSGSLVLFITRVVLVSVHEQRANVVGPTIIGARLLMVRRT